MPEPDSEAVSSMKEGALPPGAPASGTLTFAVSRNGSPLGRHALAFSQAGDKFEVEVKARFTWKLGFVTLFRYKLEGHEVWRAGRLESAEFWTDNNSAAAHMRLRRVGKGLRVEGSTLRSYLAPPDWLIATHWNARQLERPMINPQDGAVLRYDVADLGLAPIPGGGEPARRWRLNGKASLDLWYDSDGFWVGLRARAFDGSRIEYRQVR